MSSKRIFGGGRVDLAGQTVNGLKVGDVAAFSPSLRWHTICQKCGTSGQTHSHEEITLGTAKCKSRGCGKEALRESLEETPRKAREKAAEIEDAKRRKREAIEAAKIKEAEEALIENTRKLHSTIKERVLSGKDDEIFVSPELVGKSMPQDEAAAFNAAQAAIFRQSNPQYHATPGNLETIGSYFTRNGIGIADAAMVEAAFTRLNSLGLIEHAPVEQQPIDQTIPSDVNLSIAPEQPKQPEGEIGIDPETGLERFFSNHEINRMSAAEYRSRFRIVPTIAELFSIPK